MGNPKDLISRFGGYLSFTITTSPGQVGVPGVGWLLLSLLGCCACSAAAAPPGALPAAAGLRLLGFAVLASVHAGLLLLLLGAGFCCWAAA